MPLSAGVNWRWQVAANIALKLATVFQTVFPQKFKIDKIKVKK